MGKMKNNHGSGVIRVRNFSEFQQERKKLVDAGFVSCYSPGAIIGSSSGMGQESMMSQYINNALQTHEITGAKGKCGPVLFSETGGENKSGKRKSNGKVIGTPDLGWMEWGIGNTSPNVVALLSGMLVYTAAGCKYNSDLLAGKGPVPKFRYTQYVGGNITSKKIDYADGGIFLQGLISEKLSLLAKLEEEHPELNDDGLGDMLDNANDVWGGGKNTSPKKSAAELLHDNLEKQIEELKADYAEWEKTNEEVQAFLKSNNLALINLQLAMDMVHFGICFPEFQLNAQAIDEKGKVVSGKMWTPKITGIKARSALTCRLERMDKENRINYVYLSNRWLDSPYVNVTKQTQSQKEDEIDAEPAISMDKATEDLARLVRNSREKNQKAQDRPTRIIMPCYYPTVGRPYYPVPSWHSVFVGDIYEYAATLISERLRRKRNSNVIGRIIYFHQEYLMKVYQQQKADSPDKQKAVLDKLYTEFNNYLQNRDNTGSSLKGSTFISASDGKDHDSVRIVEIESNSKNIAEANQKELLEISSILFFAQGLDSQLIGNTPGTTASGSGADLRVRYLSKQIQMSTTQELLMSYLDVVNSTNEWDAKHLVWEIEREVMTTLDNSKTGITTAQSA